MALTKGDKDFVLTAITTATQASEKRIVKRVVSYVDKRFNQLDAKIDDLEDNVLKTAKTDYLTMRDIEKRLKKVEKRLAD